MTDNPRVTFDSLVFTLEAGRLRMSPAYGARSFRSASLLKPLYAWAAYDLFLENSEVDKWPELAEPSIVFSVNATTTEYWEKYGADSTLDRLRQKTSVEWNYITGSHTWGSLSIDAGSVAKAYGELLNSSETSARRILGWMASVSDRQTFGAKQTMANHLGINPVEVAAKAGWFIDEAEQELHSHVVLIAEIRPGDYLGLVVLSAASVSGSFVRDYLERYRSGVDVLDTHIQVVARDIQAEVGRLLEQARLL